MIELQTKKDFNNKYIKLGLISKGPNGKIYAVKPWAKKDEFFAMKAIRFKNLNINILYEILRKKRRCLNEQELKIILKNGIINTLQIMHNNGLILNPRIWSMKLVIIKQQVQNLIIIIQQY